MILLYKLIGYYSETIQLGHNQFLCHKVKLKTDISKE